MLDGEDAAQQEAEEDGDGRRAVLLLGWTGCRPRHLAKYAELWRELGWRPICHTEHSSLLTLLRPGRMDALARRLLEQAVRVQPAAVHVFSNGGALLWTRVLALAARGVQRGALDRLECQVLDSTPGNLADIRAGFHFCWAMARRWWLRLLVLVLFPFLAAAAGAGYLVTLQWLPGWSRDLRWKAAWARHLQALGVRRHLVLLSADDKLIARDSVVRFARMLAGGGREVKVKEWPESRHCEHLRLHPDEYRTELRQFLTAGAEPRASCT